MEWNKIDSMIKLEQLGEELKHLAVCAARMGSFDKRYNTLYRAKNDEFFNQMNKVLKDGYITRIRGTVVQGLYSSIDRRYYDIVEYTPVN